MPVLDTIYFTDRDSGDAAFVLVRVEETTVDLTLSLESNGDLSVFFGLNELERLIQALHEARQQLKLAQSPPRE
jgi:hypothetical protein